MYFCSLGSASLALGGQTRAAFPDFIKAMFPDVMKDIEQDSIRNFKFQPNKGSIVIDEPDEDDYHFHIK